MVLGRGERPHVALAPFTKSLGARREREGEKEFSLRIFHTNPEVSVRLFSLSFSLCLGEVAIGVMLPFLNQTVESWVSQPQPAAPRPGMVVTRCSTSGG